ncbi:solute carrier family 22 member 7-like [Plakobranchus ocellatus]|uniref:Solute carrier family 22 member 7-like n=1 Tax=Plakobranchus ocellatus TaxID=259542 RepID=A0AAV4B1Y8_9GAST|nr:solute carrier family 22 member 7-like [Plakobranchus ocellatus]
MPASSNSIYSPVGQSQSSQKMTTIEDIYDRIGGMGKFQIMAIVLLYGTMAIQSFNIMLMGYAGYIGTFECITHPKFNQTTSEFYTNVSVSMATTDPDVDKETSLNVCSVNGTRCQDFKFLESKKTAVTEVGLDGQGLVMTVPYPTEFLPKRWRHILPPMPVWQLGVMIMAATAWWLEDWSHLHIACVVIIFVFTLGCFYVPESPRWLATQGKVDESYSVLEKIARVNKKRLPPGAKEILQKISKFSVEDQRGKKYTYLDLFKTKKNIKLTLIFALQWVTMSVIYYGINFAVNSFVATSTSIS